MMTRYGFPLAMSAVALTIGACSGGADPDGDTPASGGFSGSTGGAVSSGGAVATGGAVSTGGGFATGGTSPDGSGGSAPVTGGAAGVGGMEPSVGGTSSGGADSGTGGAGPADGGSSGTGGAPPVPEPSLVTSGPGNYWQIGELTAAQGNATVTINDSQALGDWHGFGGTFNEKGWAALKGLSQADRDKAMALLFDPNEGCAFTYGRIPIGSSDYALSRYSLAETANDFEMENFSIERDRMDLIPYIQAALAIQPDLHLWASPWSPPPWMKSNNAYDRGNMKEDAATLDAHALYLARFVEEYEKEGIYVESVQPQNEPGYQQDYPSCGWSGGLMATYIRDHLGPLFAERLPDREIWLGTISNPTSKSIVDTVMSNGGASSYVSGIGVQWSQDQYVPEYLRNYGVPVMQTEHRCGNFPNAQQSNINRAPNDDAYARESWGYIAHYIRQGVSSYMAWNMVLDPAGRNLDMVRPWAQNALLVADGSQLIVTPTYYVFRHVAQYVDPGSVRIGTQGGDVVAWKNPDGDIVAVLYNSQNSASDVVVSIGGGTYRVSIPGQGWATVNWQAP